MATIKTTNRLSTTDAAYVAGLIDGEGTITLSRKHRNENRQLVVSISNTEYQLLEFVKETAGAGKITGKKIYNPKHTPGFTYAICNRQALDLVVQISPYLKTYKKQRADLIIADYIRLAPRNGKYTDHLLAERNVFEEKLLVIKPGA